MKILLLASSFSGLCQRVIREFILDGHDIREHYGMDLGILSPLIEQFEPELIICPFLKDKIPEDIWRKNICLIVHPGIEGDRGPSSLDWAISSAMPYWGVTLLQAAEEMDAGDIWGTQEFPLRIAGKTSIYKREVSQAAVELIKTAIKNFQSKSFKPRPLDYDLSHVKGRCLPLMRQNNRAINWQNDSTATIIDKLNAADTSPGIADSMYNYAVHLFGAINEPELTGDPGEIIAVGYGSICRATVDGAVWIRQLKIHGHESLPAIKLPAEQAFSEICPPLVIHLLREASKDINTANDIKVEYENNAAFVYFNFYNGGCSTEQCLRLKNTLREVKRADIKAIVLMGGDDFFGNGIHLNCIEAANNPADESWANINAIDDVVEEIINCPNQITISGLRNNAGAGGAIVALACDHVVARDGIVLNPHYKKMGLYGSEYWTYLLPKRIGNYLAQKITDRCEPMLAKEALKMGMIDKILPEQWHQYHQQLKDYVEETADDAHFDFNLLLKRRRRELDEQKKPLYQYRQEELAKMQENFYGHKSLYHNARREFVYKGKVPAHLKITTVAS